MIDGKFRGAKWIGLAALLLLAACGGGNSGQDGDLVVRQPTAPQTMHKPVARLTCDEAGLEGTTFAADLQAIHAASLVPEKIYCKLNKNEYGELPAVCGIEIRWFHIFLDVPPDQVDKAKALGYAKFAPPANADYEDFPCLK